MTKTLGDFIEQQLVMRQMSAAEFARFIDVPESLISKFRNHGISNIYANKPVGNPSGEFMYKLHKATKYGIDSLWRLVYPDIEAPDIENWVIARQITELPDEYKKMFDILFEGVASEIVQGKR